MNSGWLGHIFFWSFQSFRFNQPVFWCKVAYMRLCTNKLFHILANNSGMVIARKEVIFNLNQCHQMTSSHIHFHTKCFPQAYSFFLDCSNSSLGRLSDLCTIGYAPSQDTPYTRQKIILITLNATCKLHKTLYFINSRLNLWG